MGESIAEVVQRTLLRMFDFFSAVAVLGLTSNITHRSFQCTVDTVLTTCLELVSVKSLLSEQQEILVES